MFKDTTGGLGDKVSPSTYELIKFTWDSIPNLFSWINYKFKAGINEFAWIFGFLTIWADDCSGVGKGTAIGLKEFVCWEKNLVY